MATSSSKQPKNKRLRFRKGFHIVMGNRRSQAAEMVIAPSESVRDADNRHRGSDQWLYVVDGSGVAIVNGKRHVLSAQTLALIERGDTHEIRNTGSKPLRTVDFYVPPAYSEEGDELPSGRK